ncbi:unnamed protein product, partial [Rotaria socialis]
TLEIQAQASENSNIQPATTNGTVNEEKKQNSVAMDVTVSIKFHFFHDFGEQLEVNLGMYSCTK